MKVVDAVTRTCHPRGPTGIKGWRGFCDGGSARRRLLRKSVPGVDEELLGHLLRKFAFVTRTAELMVTMSRTAQAFFKGFDCSEWTEMEIYRTTVLTIAAAMDIPMEEEMCRQHLKGKANGEAREAHADMMKGELGKTKSWLGITRVARLPGGKVAG